MFDLTRGPSCLNLYRIAETFRISVQNENSAEKTFADCSSPIIMRCGHKMLRRKAFMEGSETAKNSPKVFSLERFPLYSILYSIQYTVLCTAYCTLYSILYSVRCTALCTVHRTLYGAPHSVRCTALCTVHRTLYGAPHSVRCTALYTVHRTLYSTLYSVRYTVLQGLSSHQAYPPPLGRM